MSDLRGKSLVAWIFGMGMLVAAVEANAFGRDDLWQSGFGQGVCEAIVTYGAGNQILVACECGAGRAVTGISFMLAGRSPTGSAITLTFDGQNPRDFNLWDGRIPSHCHACAANFDAVLDLFRSRNSVHVRFENGDSAVFTLNGAAEAIGDCPADFWRTELLD